MATQTHFGSQVVPLDSIEKQGRVFFPYTLFGSDVNGLHNNGDAPGEIPGLTLPTTETGIMVFRFPIDLDPTQVTTWTVPVSIKAALNDTDVIAIAMTYTKAFSLTTTGADGTALVDPATTTGITTVVGTKTFTTADNWTNKVIAYQYTIAANTFSATDVLSNWHALGLTPTLTGAAISEYVIGGVYLEYTRRFV